MQFNLAESSELVMGLFSTFSIISDQNRKGIQFSQKLSHTRTNLFPASGILTELLNSDWH